MSNESAATHDNVVIGEVICGEEQPLLGINARDNAGDSLYPQIGDRHVPRAPLNTEFNSVFRQRLKMRLAPKFIGTYLILGVLREFVVIRTWQCRLILTEEKTKPFLSRGASELGETVGRARTWPR